MTFQEPIMIEHQDKKNYSVGLNIFQSIQDQYLNQNAHT